MRRIALLSDIHGNLPALDAVLADIAANGIEERFCLGDLVGYGPDPSGVIDRVREMGVVTLLGNYDDGVGHRRGECGCHYATEQARADGEASYEFTVARVDDARAEWLTELPAEARFEHAGARVLLAHGSPRRLNEYLLPDRTDEQLARLARDADADLVCIGHVHVSYHRMPAPGIHFVSSGSVGKPKDGDPRACWVELVMGTEDEVRVAVAEDAAAGPAGETSVWVGAIAHRVVYDVDAVVAAMREAGLPPTLADALRRA